MLRFSVTALMQNLEPKFKLWNAHNFFETIEFRKMQP